MKRGCIFYLPYQKYSPVTYEIETGHDAYKVICKGDNGSILAQDIDKKRKPCLFSKEQIQDFNLKTANQEAEKEKWIDLTNTNIT